MTEKKKLINVDLYGDGSRNSRLRAEYERHWMSQSSTVYERERRHRAFYTIGMMCTCS